MLNKDELRCKLRTLGFQFKTELDEEVIVNAYIYYKENCFNYFKGAYSIIIYTSNKVIIARDKLGIKPLFYSLKDDNFIFSNEIKSLLKSNLGFFLPFLILAKSRWAFDAIGPGLNNAVIATKSENSVGFTCLQ